MNKQDTETFKELGLIIAIGFVLAFVFLTPDETAIQSEPPMVEFYDFPLQAWQTLDKRGKECVKIKYLVDRSNTKLYMFNRNGKIVHKQPLALSPHKNDRDRVETYVWKLYRTEWTDNISPGKYQIVVGTEHQKTGISIEIEII